METFLSADSNEFSVSDTNNDETFQMLNSLPRVLISNKKLRKDRPITPVRRTLPKDDSLHDLLHSTRVRSQSVRVRSITPLKRHGSPPRRPRNRVREEIMQKLVKGTEEGERQLFN